MKNTEGKIYSGVKLKNSKRRLGPIVMKGGTDIRINIVVFSHQAAYDN